MPEYGIRKHTVTYCHVLDQSDAPYWRGISLSENLFKQIILVYNDNNGKHLKHSLRHFSGYLNVLAAFLIIQLVTCQTLQQVQSSELRGKRVRNECSPRLAANIANVASVAYCFTRTYVIAAQGKQNPHSTWYSACLAPHTNTIHLFTGGEYFILFYEILYTFHIECCKRTDFVEIVWTLPWYKT